MITPEQAAYIAGFLDGEGTISCFSTQDKEGNVRTKIEITLYNTNIEVLEWIKNLVGGTLHEIKRKKKMDHWKTPFALHFAAMQSRNLLHQVMNYLIVKKRQAELTLEFGDTMMLASDGRKSGLPLEVIEKRLRIMNEMKILNRRGA